MPPPKKKSQSSSSSAPAASTSQPGAASSSGGSGGKKGAGGSAGSAAGASRPGGGAQPQGGKLGGGKGGGGPKVDPRSLYSTTSVPSKKSKEPEKDAKPAEEPAVEDAPAAPQPDKNQGKQQDLPMLPTNLPNPASQPNPLAGVNVDKLSLIRLGAKVESDLHALITSTLKITGPGN
jgi:hypothetical protein